MNQSGSPFEGPPGWFVASAVQLTQQPTNEPTIQLTISPLSSTLSSPGTSARSPDRPGESGSPTPRPAPPSGPCSPLRSATRRIVHASRCPSTRATGAALSAPHRARGSALVRVVPLDEERVHDVLPVALRE